MLRCTIELIPHGNILKKETLADLIIINNGTGTPEIGNYNVRLEEKGKVYKGKVKNYPRLQYGPAFLVAKAIEACLNPE